MKIEMKKLLKNEPKPIFEMIKCPKCNKSADSIFAFINSFDNTSITLNLIGLTWKWEWSIVVFDPDTKVIQCPNKCTEELICWKNIFLSNKHKSCVRIGLCCL